MLPRFVCRSRLVRKLAVCERIIKECIGCNFLYFLALFDNKKVVKLRSLTKRVNFDKYQVRKKQGNCGVNLSLAYN